MEIVEVNDDVVTATFSLGGFTFLHRGQRAQAQAFSACGAASGSWEQPPDCWVLASDMPWPERLAWDARTQNLTPIKMDVLMMMMMTMMMMMMQMKMQMVMTMMMQMKMNYSNNKMVMMMMSNQFDWYPNDLTQTRATFFRNSPILSNTKQSQLSNLFGPQTQHHILFDFWGQWTVLTLANCIGLMLWSPMIIP